MVAPPDGEVLLIRRAVPESALVWQFPAGKVDAGESPGGAAAREAVEEAGVTVVPRRHRWCASPPGDGSARGVRGLPVGVGRAVVGVAPGGGRLRCCAEASNTSPNGTEPCPLRTLSPPVSTQKSSMEDEHE
ncbi:NUDIX hydrolase [Streptomyces sp. cg28]|uniref:NUDIX hydrolase n=1 Tax=Streptomyces sp. cg28 TaxID=3403457 RepID=UPI003B219C55